LSFEFRSWLMLLRHFLRHITPLHFFASSPDAPPRFAPLFASFSFHSLLRRWPLSASRRSFAPLRRFDFTRYAISRMTYNGFSLRRVMMMLLHAFFFGFIDTPPIAVAS